MILRLLSFIACRTPEAWISPLGRFFGMLWYHAVPYRRSVMRQNLARAFSELERRSREALCKSACMHLLLALLEFLRIPRHAANRFADVLRVEGLEHYRAAQAKGLGVLCLTGHLGSFEIAASGIAARLEGEPIALVVKSFPRGTDRFVTSLRALSKLRMIPARGGMRDILASLARKEAVVLVLDQNATRKRGVFVDFFGEPACTLSALALVALRTKAPVIATASWREPDGTHVLRVYPEIPLDPRGSRKATIRHMTQVYTRFIEARIREHPEQWLWTHRRWKTRPVR